MRGTQNRYQKNCEGSRLNIDFENSDDVAVLTLRGRFDSDKSRGLVRSEVTRLIGDGTKLFVIDFSDVPYCDSAGTGELITVFRSLQNAGGAMAIVGPCERVHRLWRNVRLLAVFNIFEDVEEARAFVRQPKPVRTTNQEKAQTPLAGI